MLKKYIFHILVLISLTAIFLFYSKNKTIKLPDMGKKDKIVMPDNSNRHKKENKPTKAKKKFISRLAKAQKQHQTVFDSDPAIDAILLKQNFNKCIEFLNGNEDTFGIKKFRAINRVSKAQQKFKQKQENYCTQLNATHPEYLLKQQKSLSLLKQGLDNQTAIGKVLSGFYNNKEEDFNIATEIQRISILNPNLLFNTRKYFGKYINQNIYPKVIAITQSHQQTYLNLVLQYAHIQYACKQGASCDEFSNIVAKLCINNNLCGNSFNDILQNKISKGIRMDILLVYTYLTQVYATT